MVTHITDSLKIVKNCFLDKLLNIQQYNALASGKEKYSVIPI